MNILAISTILPIPGIKKSNDFVLRTYINYLKLYEKDRVVIIVPLKYNLNPLALFRREKVGNKPKQNEQLKVEGIQIEVFRFLSAWGYRNLHSIVTRSIYYLNKRRLKQLFSLHQFDIIHAQYIYSDGVLANILSRKYHIPYMVNTHNERFYFDHIISKHGAIRILKDAAKVLPINHSNYLYFKSLDLDNLERNVLGFNKEFIKSQRTGTRRKVSILTVAELIKLKNIDKVIYALVNLMSKYDITYTVIGRGPEKGHLESLTKEMKLDDKISFVEQIPHEQIAVEMYKHDIFIMPSYFETFGRVYFEAMAMGIPIICAKNSGIYGLFKDGEEGLAVDHQNIDEMQSALEHLISDTKERLRIGRNGQELVKNFTWEHIAKDLNQKYMYYISN